METLQRSDLFGRYMCETRRSPGAVHQAGGVPGPFTRPFYFIHLPLCTSQRTYRVAMYRTACIQSTIRVMIIISYHIVPYYILYTILYRIISYRILYTHITVSSAYALFWLYTGAGSASACCTKRWCPCCPSEQKTLTRSPYPAAGVSTSGGPQCQSRTGTGPHSRPPLHVRVGNWCI